MQSKNAVGNLIKKYSAVLKKCAWLNACVLTGAVVCGGLAPVGVACAATPTTLGEAFRYGGEYTMTTDHSGAVRPELEEDLVLNGGGYNIDGGGSATYTDWPVIQLDSATLTLSNITIQGYVKTEDVLSANALILLNGDDEALIINGGVTIQNNDLHNAGGVFNGNKSHLTINGTDGNVKFINNNTGGAEGSDAGAIDNYGTANITGTLFQENTTSGEGGAIFNTAYMSISKSTFEGNEAKFGGAIYSKYDEYEPDSFYLSIQDSSFTKNKASTKGGALYVDYSCKITSIDNVTFGDKDDTASGNTASDGGAILNWGTIEKIENSDFFNNVATSLGGAIYNGGEIKDIQNTSFISNKAPNSSGAAIYNNGTMSISKGTFEDNVAKTYGAIYNYGTMSISNDSTFTGNEAKNGAAISNKHNRNDVFLTIQDSSFTKNIASSQGGAIYNGSSCEITSIDNVTFGDKDDAESGNTAPSGGAICNVGTIENISGGSFENNIASTYGGAICNVGTIENISGGSFENNKASSLTGASTYGGAIFNQGTVTVKNTSFIGNTATSGGAIYNNYSSKGVFLTIQDSSFTKNIASSQGGAIANNYNDFTIIATNKGGGVVFEGNTVNGVSNAIYNKGGKVSLYAESDSTITFDDGIETDYHSAIYLGNIIIGGVDGNTTYDGTVIMNNLISGDGSVELYDGTFKLGLYEADGKTTNFADTLDLVLNGGTVDMQDDDEEQTPPSAVQQRQMSAMSQASQTPTSVKPQRQTLDTVTLGGNVTMKLDLVLDNDKSAMDGFKANSYTGKSADLNLNLAIKETSATDEKIAVLFTDCGSFEGNTLGALEGNGIEGDKYTGAVYEYDVKYLVADEAGDGMTVGDSYITFEREAFNPETATADVAAASLFIFQDEIYTRLFRSHNATKDRIEAKEEGAAFMSVFGGKEQLDFENFGYDVNLKTAGTIVGYEGNSLDLGSDAEVFLSMYGAYVRGESDFADSELIQDSYYLGAGANFHKGDAYLLSTALMSVTNNEVRDTGSDSFISYTAGLGLEGGYVFDLGEGFTLQPNVFASFTYINSEAWETGRGAAISDGDFYELRLSPGLRLDKEFTDTVTGYAFGRYVHIEVDGTTMTANDITLPDISLKPYAEYGVGFSSEWDSLTFFAEGLCRNGGREGWEGQVGFKYTW